MLDSRQISLRCVLATFPAEASMLGEDTVRDVVDAVWEGEKYEEDPSIGRARQMDVVEAIKLVAAIAGLLKTLIEVWILLGKGKPKPATKAELIGAYRAQHPDNWPSYGEQVVDSFLEDEEINPK